MKSLFYAVAMFGLALSLLANTLRFRKIISEAQGLARRFEKAAGEAQKIAIDSQAIAILAIKQRDECIKSRTPL